MPKALSLRVTPDYHASPVFGQNVFSRACGPGVNGQLAVPPAGQVIFAPNLLFRHPVPKTNIIKVVVKVTLAFHKTIPDVSE